VAAGGRQKRYRLLNRHAPADFLGKRGPARRTLGFLPFLDRAGSQLGEAAALLPAEEVPIAALLYVVGRLVQAYVALQVVRDVLVLAPPGGDRGGVGGGAHVTMEGQKRRCACRSGEESVPPNNTEKKIQITKMTEPQLPLPNSAATSI
jgi:hypothetical protein